MTIFMLLFYLFIVPMGSDIIEKAAHGDKSLLNQNKKSLW